jgi:hypothetical protein
MPAFAAAMGAKRVILARKRSGCFRTDGAKRTLIKLASKFCTSAVKFAHELSSLAAVQRVFLLRAEKGA